jgi:hypothetical protein
MTTKIDISSLDDITKEKIKAIQQRCSELANGQEITVNLPIKIEYGWFNGNNGVVSEWGHYPKDEIDWEIVKQHEKEIQHKLDTEIKEILDFSNSVADRLSVDRDEFFQQYFAA